MQLEIKPLSPDLLEDYLYFFENVAHTDNPEWDRCYCLNYCSVSNKEANFSSPDFRRELAIDYVNKGQIQGYMAFVDGKPIGWCNTQKKDDCLDCAGWGLLSSQPFEFQKNPKVKSIFCFTVAPHMRRKGVSKALINRAIEDAVLEGFDFVEAYPNKNASDEYYDYVGPLALYQSFGFEVVQEMDKRLVVQKPLR